MPSSNHRAHATKKNFWLAVTAANKTIWRSLAILNTYKTRRKTATNSLQKLDKQTSLITLQDHLGPGSNASQFSNFVTLWQYFSYITG
jgi:hypothetical protein